MNSLTIQSTAQDQALEITRWSRVSSDSVTPHPIEEGVDVVDHVQQRPEAFVLDVIATNTPLPDAAQGGTATVEAFLTAARGQLLTLTLDREGVFSNYVLTNIARVQAAVDSRTYTLSIVQIRFARALTVLITPTQTQVVGAPDRQSAGQQATAEEEVPASNLRDMQKVFQGFTGIGVQ